MQKAENQLIETDEDSKQKQATGKIQQQLALVEAALYVAGRPLNLKQFCSVLKTRSKGKARKLVKMLVKGYSMRNTALEILELKDERYVLQLKKEFTPNVRKLVKRPLLSEGPLKTLAYIAYKQPVSQRRVAEMRGHHAYSHMKQLKEMDLVVGRKSGRLTVLRTTEYFADYFGLSHEFPIMKRQIKKVFEEDITSESK